VQTEELEDSHVLLKMEVVLLAEEGIRERIVNFEVDDLHMHLDHC